MKKKLSHSALHNLSDSNHFDTIDSVDNFAQKSLTLFQYKGEFKKIITKQQNLKNNIAFWNSMADGRFQNISSITNLFILLLVITLGGKVYNGAHSNGPIVLGWISIAQVCFFYLLVVLVKFIYIPYLESKLQKQKTEGFIIFDKIYSEKKQVQSFDPWEIQVLKQTLRTRQKQFRNLTSKSQIISIINDINSSNPQILKRRQQAYQQIKQIKKEQSRQKYWQQFWQVFMVTKTYTIPGVILLLLIITSDTMAKVVNSSVAMNNAQGWIAIGIWAFFILLLIIIFTCVWDYVDQKVQNAKSQPFLTYYQIYTKQKQLKNLTINQLEQIKTVIKNRSNQFNQCFPEQNSSQTLQNINRLLHERLPLKGSESQQNNLNLLIKKQNSARKCYNHWVTFFSKYMVSTIINILKFLIVMALTFQYNYPPNEQGIKNAQIAIGSIGIGAFVFGYIFYAILRCCLLQRMKNNVDKLSTKPFTNYRLVYFGNKKIQDLKIHELQQINKATIQRKQQFVSCFPNTNIQSLQSDIASLHQKSQKISTKQSQSILLKQQIHAKQMLTFWNTFADGPMLQAMYSIYVLIVLLVVSIIASNKGAKEALGWLGVAVIGSLILIVLFFKCYLLERMANTVKAKKIQGVSQYHQVYIKAKQLKNVQKGELQQISRMIENNPTQFGRCFPNANIQKVQSQINSLPKQNHSPIIPYAISSRDKVELQKLKLQLARKKDLLVTWRSLIMDKLYVWLPISIVVFILWGQTIATTLYGLTVCGFLCVAILSVAVLLILFYNLWYKGHLTKRIQQIEQKIQSIHSKH